MATILTVTFDDGATQEITIRPIHLVMAERQKSGGRENPIEFTFLAGWIALGSPGRFDDWLEKLVDGKETEEAVPPPNPDPSSAESLTSP